MQIKRVITVYLDFDDMAKVNDINGFTDNRTDIWCDKDCFDELPRLNKFIEPEIKDILDKSEIDFIVFRLDY